MQRNIREPKTDATTRKQIRIQETEDTLRDIAFVLQVTRRIKEEILAGLEIEEEVLV